MIVRIVEDDPTNLAEYARIAIGFSVDEVFDEEALAALLRGDRAIATPLGEPYWKDYDAQPDNRPTYWPRRFDLSRWTILVAFADGERVGGAVVIVDDPQIELLRDGDMRGLLWDLRVASPMRGRGVGSALVRGAEETAVRRGARVLQVETQQINVAACRFYARLGFRLEHVTRGAYAELPDEMQLLWRKALDVSSGAAAG
jgi:ribosomal protein S18 acetylase RimI-like enzyme